MQVSAKELLAVQDNCVAVWQLRAQEMSEKVIRTMVRDWQRLHDGVYVATFGDPTQDQRHRAAALTTPTTFLADFSAAACWEIRQHDGVIQAVVRPGNTGLREMDNLRIRHSVALDGETTTHHGIPITTPERTTIDLSPHLADTQRRKLLREGLRLRRLTIPSLDDAVQRHRGRAGTKALKQLTTFYSTLQLHRCKSDAEAFAMEILHTAKRDLPDPNEMTNGYEADLTWRRHNLIVEIDGPQFHRDKHLDAIKAAAWTTAGYTVRRIDSDDIFNRPQRLLDFAPG